MATIKAVLFDADNTLFPTRSIAGKADMAAMRLFSKASGTSVQKAYREWQGIVSKARKSRNPGLRTRAYSYRMLAKKLGVKVHAQAHVAFVKELLRLLKPFPQAARTLAALRRRRLKLAVITEDSRELALKKLRRTKLLGYFDAVVTSSDAKVMKPSPVYCRMAAGKLKVKPSECLVVGDDYELDLRPAKKLGAKVLQVKRRSNTLPRIP